MTTIILNADSLAALFPPGTEAHVKLQATVLERLAKQAIKNPDLTGEILNTVAAARKCVTADVLKEMGATKTWNAVTLGDDMKEAIRKQAKTAVTFAISDVIEETMSDKDVKLVAQRFLDIHVENAVKKALDAQLAALVALATAMKEGGK